MGDYKMIERMQLVPGWTEFSIIKRINTGCACYIGAVPQGNQMSPLHVMEQNIYVTVIQLAGPKPNNIAA